jgi:hypothetical protein
MEEILRERGKREREREREEREEARGKRLRREITL